MFQMIKGQLARDRSLCMMAIKVFRNEIKDIAKDIVLDVGIREHKCVYHSARSLASALSFVLHFEE